MAELKVGSIIYRRDGLPTEIVGETKVSWLIGDRQAELQTALELLREYAKPHSICANHADHRCPTCQRLEQSKLLEGK